MREYIKGKPSVKLDNVNPTIVISYHLHTRDDEPEINEYFAKHFLSHWQKHAKDTLQSYYNAGCNTIIIRMDIDKFEEFYGLFGAEKDNYNGVFDAALEYATNMASELEEKIQYIRWLLNGNGNGKS